MHDDEALIAGAANGELGALETLYDRYGRVAFSLAYRIVGDRSAAEDVVQEAFLSLWRQAKSYRRERGSARTWLMAIVHHRSIDRLRATTASHPASDPLPETKDRGLLHTCTKISCITSSASLESFNTRSATE